MKIGFIGTGTISSKVIEGIAGNGHDILVSERGRETSAQLAAAFPNVTVAGNQAVIDGSDVVLLGLMVDVAREVLPGLRFRAGQEVISVMTGMDLAELARQVAPASSLGVAFPFPSIAQGGAPVMACPGGPRVAGVFGAQNHTFSISDEGEMAVWTAAQAVLSPSLKLVQLALEWLGERASDKVQAEGFLRLVVGSALMAEPLDRPGVLEAALKALDTPGGYNATLREHMLAGGMGDTLRAGLDALEARAKG
jgi:pyrroline-5-carboxylate reductase